MSHTHFLFHIVFATKDRKPLISPGWERELYSYLAGIIKNHSGSVLAIDGMPDHVHILARLDLKIAFPDFMRELKAGSSRWVKQNHLSTFAWQSRYGAFSVSESVAGKVREYVQNQKAHHTKTGFEDEYRTLLRKHKVDFNEDYPWS